MIENGNTCVIGFSENDDQIPHSIFLGTLFLRSFYSVYDLEKRQFGLAPVSASTIETRIIDTWALVLAVIFGTLFICCCGFCIYKIIMIRRMIKKFRAMKMAEQQRLMAAQKAAQA